MDFLDKVLNKPLEVVELSNDKETIIFTFEDGTSQSFGVEGDCCSSSWIEHLTLPEENMRGLVITKAEESGDVAWDNHKCDPEVEYSRKCGHSHLQVYNVHFQTDKGDIILEFRNDSNGYYGGYLVER